MISVAGGGDRSTISPDPHANVIDDFIHRRGDEKFGCGQCIHDDKDWPG
jgi:hypothetical protein